MTKIKNEFTSSTYKIEIKGHMDPEWADWFNGMQITHEDDGTTTLIGAVADQAALQGILKKISNLNLALISVNKIKESNQIRSNKMINLIKKYSVASFYILALLLGAGVTFLVVQGILPSGLIMLAATSASLSAIILTAIIDGKEGLKKLFAGLLIWRAKIGWWLFALLFLAVAVPLGFFMNPLFGGDTMDLSNIQPVYSIIPMLIIFFITAGLGEELGWTGFLTPRLQARYNALVTSIIRSVLWGLWHFPLFIFGFDHPSLSQFPYPFWVSQYGFWIAMGAFILINQLPWSIFYTWIYNNTRGSLLFVAILHGSEVWVAYWGLSAAVDSNKFVNYWGYGIVMLVAAVIVLFTNGAENLSRKHERIIRQEV
jgi:membrane protease YdiL (CAAX protease family)